MIDNFVISYRRRKLRSIPIFMGAFSLMNLLLSFLLARGFICINPRRTKLCVLDSRTRARARVCVYTCVRWNRRVKICTCVHVSLPDAGSERANGPGGVDALQLLQAEVQWRGAMSQVSQLQALLLSTLHREQSAERSWPILRALLETDRSRWSGTGRSTDSLASTRPDQQSVASEDHDEQHVRQA